MTIAIQKLHKLLSMKVEIDSQILSKKVMITPEFRLAYQGERQGGKHFTIHAAGHNSDTLDIVVKPDTIEILGDPQHRTGRDKLHQMFNTRKTL